MKKIKNLFATQGFHINQIFLKKIWMFYQLMPF